MPSSDNNFQGIPGPADKSNRRRNGRVLCQEIQCSLGEVLDLSGTGMRIRTRERIPTDGAPIGVILNGMDRQIYVICRIAWIKKAGFFQKELGLRFENPNPETLAALNALARNSVYNETVRPDVERFRKAQ